MTCLKAPFPYFGGKSAVADEVWRRFSRAGVTNYIEPFCGSAAMLLARPQPFKGVETINDADGFVANFWRAMVKDPEQVAHHADWPVNEADLHARHLWLVGQRESITERLMGDAEWCDPKAAGWWVWGACAWIGSGWCSGKGPWISVDGVLTDSRTLEGTAGCGINRQLPHLGTAGCGINRQLPHLGNAGCGINRQLPHLGNAGRGKVWAHLLPIAERMRDVRVACGDWRRVLGSLFRNGCTGYTGEVVGVFLDPPYGEGQGYNVDDPGVADAAWGWAISAANKPESSGRAKTQHVIAVCGYDDGRTAPEGWECWRWDANTRPRSAGYGNSARGSGRENAARECIWFSPGLADDGQSGQLSLLEAL